MTSWTGRNVRFRRATRRGVSGPRSGFDSAEHDAGTKIDGADENLSCAQGNSRPQDVENCELDPAKAYAVNALGARNLAAVVRDLGAVLVHVSTDYVFDGNKSSPYEETDCPGH